MKLRVGCVEYINALPLTLAFKLNPLESEADFFYSIPSTLNRLLKQGELDIALTSCVAYLDGDYQMLPDYGIAAQKEILSVNLYTQLPLEKLNKARVGVTHHSATSVSLLKVLCQHFWNVEPHFEPLNRDEPFSNYKAVLLIGDEALQNLSLPGFQTIDLAKAWYQATRLPFTFAVFSCKKSLSEQKLRQFQEQLEGALAWSHAHPALVEEAALKQSQLSLPLVHAYFSLCTYKLGENELKSLSLFKQLRENVSTICT